MTDDLLRRLALANEARKRTPGWSWSRRYWSKVAKQLQRKADQARKLERFDA